MLRIWGLHSADRIQKTISRQFSTKILRPIEDIETRTLYSLINGRESIKLEFKAGYFKENTDPASKNKGKLQLTEVTDLMCRVNATINAFANTLGGDLIIGKHDKDINIDDMDGLGSALKYYTKMAEKEHKNVNHAMENIVMIFLIIYVYGILLIYN